VKKRVWAIALLMATLAAAGAFMVWRDLYRPFRGYQGNAILVIAPGTHAWDVASIFTSRGILAHRWPFLFRYWLGRSRHRLRAGEYLFDRPLSPADVYRKLILGDVFLHAVVIPEGSDRFDTARIFQQQLELNPQEFLQVSERSAAIRDLDPQAPTLEGYLFPDTYRFPRGVSVETVISAMLTRFRHVLAGKLAQSGRGPGVRLHEVVTLASMVEKETPAPGERPVIAGIFARRLAKGMALQCDPTVVYAARLHQRPIGPITEQDLNINSPYNTYRYSGLPPGPICNPGEASLAAALQPAQGNTLYFVSNGHGGHVFARTLAEHQSNVARYRKALAALRREVGSNTRRVERGSPPQNHRENKAKNPSVKSAQDSLQKTGHP